MDRDNLPPNLPPAEVPLAAPRGFTARLRNYFLTGLIVAGPIAITSYLTWWFVTWVDGLVRPFVPQAYRPETYLPFEVPGAGLVVADASRRRATARGEDGRDDQGQEGSRHTPSHSGGSYWKSEVRKAGPPGERLEKWTGVSCCEIRIVGTVVGPSNIVFMSSTMLTKRRAVDHCRVRSALCRMS